MLLPRFDPPGLLNDLNDQQKKAWSDSLSGLFDTESAAAGVHFFNPTKKDTAADQQTLEIRWTAFPRIVQIMFPADQDRWREADRSRSRQDEYCEWSVTRQPVTKKITKVMFTCEGPEYWEFLGGVNPDRVLALYQEHIGPQVRRQHLFSANGRYNPRNRWNNSASTGAMHLVQVNNTLGAEINIASRGTIVRQIGGQLLTDEQELIECGKYGEKERHSDPHIGAQVNMLARQKADVTLANPVALYIGGLNTAGWQSPDGSDPKQYWKITRGNAQLALRAIFEVPASKGFVVGDIKINNKPIKWAAQIADFITMKLTGVACRLGQSTVPPATQCVGDLAPAPHATVAEVLNRPAIQAHR